MCQPFSRSKSTPTQAVCPACSELFSAIRLTFACAAVNDCAAAVAAKTNAATKAINDNEKRLECTNMLMILPGMLQPTRRRPASSRILRQQFLHEAPYFSLQSHIFLAGGLAGKSRMH